MSEESGKGPWVDKKVVVLCGGESSEREVSLRTGEAFREALESLGYEVSAVDVSAETLSTLAADPPDVAMIALHGGIGENGSIQGFLECLSVPYTGSGVYSSALAMNKATSKTMWDKAGLPTPPWQVFERERVREILDRDSVDVALPTVIKPACGGSSVGVTLVKRPEDFFEGLKRVLRQPGPALVERLVQGRELSVALMDGQLMGVVEIRTGRDFYDYTAKYEDEETRYIIPAPLPNQVHEEVARIAPEAVRVLGARGVVRLDLILDEEERPWLLELNTIPGMTQTSLVPKIAAKTGLSFARFVEMMVNRACLDAEVEYA